ncbi:MAG TPA: CHASE3 domain-containing protein, partial [Telluria sp.]|nr:CHASE3 domain-containing protein [Telluria sp.]
MFADLSVKKKLYFGFSSMVAIILVLLVLAYNQFAQLSEASGWDRHTLEVLLEADKISISVLDLQSMERGYIITGDERMLASAGAKEAELASHLQKVTSLTADNAIQQARLKQLAGLTDDWLKKVYRPLVEMRRKLDKTSAAADQIGRTNLLQEGAQAVAAVNRLIDDVGAEETLLLASRSQRAAALQQRMTLLLTLGGIACVVLAIGVAYLLARALLVPLNNLTQAVGRIAAGEQSARAALISNDELGKVS